MDNIVAIDIKHKESNMSLSNIFNLFPVKLDQNNVKHVKKIISSTTFGLHLVLYVDVNKGAQHVPQVL